MKKFLFVAIIAASTALVSCGDSAAEQATKDSMEKVRIDSLAKDSMMKATPVIVDTMNKMAPMDTMNKMAPMDTTSKMK